CAWRWETPLIGRARPVAGLPPLQGESTGILEALVRYLAGVQGRQGIAAGPSRTLHRRGQHDPLVEDAQHLVDPRARPDVEEREIEERQELPIASLPSLLRRLAGARRPDGPDQAVLVIDAGVLD